MSQLKSIPIDRFRVRFATDVGDLPPGLNQSVVDNAAGLVNACGHLGSVVVEDSLGDDGDGVVPRLEVGVR